MFWLTFKSLKRKILHYFKTTLTNKQQHNGQSFIWFSFCIKQIYVQYCRSMIKELKENKKTNFYKKPLSFSFWFSPSFYNYFSSRLFVLVAILDIRKNYNNLKQKKYINCNFIGINDIKKTLKSKKKNIMI